jgi:hypothetical protein
LVPSADEATDHQYSWGTLFEIQVVPELVEVKIAASPLPPKNGVATTILVPSADEATDAQSPGGALVCVQVWANAESVTVNNPPQVATASSMDLMIFMMFLSHLTTE